MIRPGDIGRADSVLTADAGENRYQLERLFDTVNGAMMIARAASSPGSNSAMSQRNADVAQRERERMGYATLSDMWRERGQYAPIVSALYARAGSEWPAGRRADTVSDARQLMADYARQQWPLVTAYVKRVGKLADRERRRIVQEK